MRPLRKSEPGLAPSAPRVRSRRRRGAGSYVRIGLAIALGLACSFGLGRFSAWAEETISAEVLARAYPGAERAGDFAGEPPAAPVYRGGERVGYLVSTHRVLGSVGFSGKPIDVLVGLALDGRIAGAHLHRHDEPILVIGVPEERLRRYVAGFADLDVRAALDVAETDAPAARLPDMIGGASISSLVIRDAVLRAARAVAHSRGLLGEAAAAARLDRERVAPADWTELRADGSIARLRLRRGEVAEAFRARGAQPVETAGAGDAPDDRFIDLHAGLITPPRVGQNLLGQQLYNRLMAEIGTDDQAVLVAGDGLYSFKGTAYRRSGVFDRIQLVQADKTIRLTEANHRRVDRLQATGAPEFREIGVFVVPAQTGFDPLRPWRLELLVARQTEGAGLVHVAFALDYTLPERYRLGPADAQASAAPAAAAAEPLWRRIWGERIGRIAVLGVILLALTSILVFQDAVARNRPFYRVLRLGFLGVTLVWIGWIAGAQLSVVNVLTFAHSLLGEFHWEFFLLEPSIFILWSYVAVAMLFWGRGVFCGWLCPFGALQELINEGARKLRVPQIKVPFAVHERLWPIKYILFLGLFAVSLHSTNLAVLGAEVEPFKTAISLKFVRHWPFVAYAAALLAAGLFVERFFCRYLCPLGAALAIPARLRMFDWLKRRHQCGRECNICAVHCTVQAIHPSGVINPNECIHCLNCQTLYYDDKTCPPLIARRKRREQRAALRADPRVERAES